MKCPNCGDPKGGHFVPPCFGDEGFFICEAIRVYEELKANAEALPPEYSKIVNEHFWELVE